MTKTLAAPVELLNNLLALIDHNIGFENHPAHELRALLAAPVADDPSPTYFEPEPANQAKCKICGTFAAYHRIGRCPESVNVAYSNSSEPKLPA